MDAFIDSSYLGAGFGILRNYVRSRRCHIQFLENLVRNKTGQSANVFPEVTTLLSAITDDVARIEESISENLAKELDHSITGKLKAATDMVLRLSAADQAAADEVVVSRVNEDSELDMADMRHPAYVKRPAATSAPRRSLTPPPLSPKKVTFSPDVVTAAFFPRKSSIKRTGFAASGSPVPRVPILVTATMPKVGDLDCLLCHQKYLKRQSLIDHLKTLHKVSSRLHDELFQTLTSKHQNDLCCVSCEDTFPTRKIAFRHSRDQHTENYNTFIKVMTMTGSLTQYRSFFMNLDRDSEDEPTDRSASQPNSQSKSRRRSRLTTEIVVAPQPSLLLLRGDHLSDPPVTRTQSVPDAPVHQPQNSGSNDATEAPAAASSANTDPLKEESETTPAKACLITSTPKRSKPEEEAIVLANDDGDGASQTPLSSPLSAKKVRSTLPPSSAKRGRGRPSGRSASKNAKTADAATDDDRDGQTILTVPDVSISFPVRKLRNRGPIPYTPLSAPLDSEMDSSNPSAEPTPAACPRCKEVFINAFERDLHCLKACRYRKPVALAGLQTRFAMKSTRPSLDAAQQQKLSQFYTTTRLRLSDDGKETESPSKSGVMLNMDAAVGRPSEPKRLRLDRDDGKRIEEPESLLSSMSLEEKHDLAVKCTQSDVKVVLDRLTPAEVDAMLSSPRCLISSH